MELHTIGIDLGTTGFHLVGLNRRGEVAVRPCGRRPMGYQALFTDESVG